MVQIDKPLVLNSDQPRVGGQDALDAARHHLRAVDDGDLAGVASSQCLRLLRVKKQVSPLRLTVGYADHPAPVEMTILCGAR